MGCGCGGQSVPQQVNDLVKSAVPLPIEMPVLVEKVSIPLPQIIDGLIRTKASICTTCWFNKNSKTCKLDGENIAGKNSCPINKFPDKHNVTRWPIVKIGKVIIPLHKWKGLAYPLRLIVASKAFRNRFKLNKKPEPLPGCGCSIFIKGLWLSIIRWFKPSNKRRKIREWPTAKLSDLLGYFYKA